MENNKNNQQSNINNHKLVKFVGKTVIVFAIGSVLTLPGAVLFGSYLYGSARCLEYLAKEEEKKEALRFISDCGKEVAFGGLIDCAVGTQAVSLTSGSTNYFGKEASKEIARNGMTDLAKELIKKGREISKLQKNLKLVNDTKEYILVLSKLKIHKKHLNSGINYLADCEVCNE